MTIRRWLAFALLAASLSAQETESQQQPREAAAAALRRDVAALAAEEMAGRFGDGASKARAYLIRAFRGAGLAPVGERFEHPFARSGMKGVNVVAVHRGSAEPERYVIVSAHYDHLGLPGGRLHPGACDNASGVAAMLAIARRLDGAETRRSIVFLAFDLEERGLLGSRAYAEKPPLPLDRCDFFVTCDMLGRKGLGLLDGLLFAQGWEWTPEVLDVLKAASAAAESPFAYFWTDIAGDRSDFVPFKARRVPHLFFSTGENPDYHQPTDTADRLDYETLARQTDAVERVVRALADRPEPFVYRREPERHLIEFESLRDLAKAIVKTRDDPRVTDELRLQAISLTVIAARVIKRGEVLPNDRRMLLKVARRIQGQL